MLVSAASVLFHLARSKLKEEAASSAARRILLICGIMLSGEIISAAAQNLSDPGIKPFTLTGSLVTAAETYRIPGLETPLPSSELRLFFNPTVTIYDIQLPFSLILSTQERSFNQPFNQFGVSPRYKMVTLHLGYRSLPLSEFSLSDAIILGAGGEVELPWLRVRGMYGRFRRSIEEDTIANTLPVYARTGWAAGIDAGGESNRIGLNILHAWDDSTSLDNRPRRTSIFPEENLTGSLAGKCSFFDGQFLLDGEFAASLWTRNTGQEAMSDSGAAAAAEGIYDARISTQLTYAARAAGTYNGEIASVRLEYARVEPEFQTMGATYTLNDREDLILSPSLRLLEGRLRLGGSIGHRRDNLLDLEGHTTHRIMGSANVNWAPAPSFALDGQFSSYSMSNAPAAFALNDTTRVENVTQYFAFSPRYVFLAGSVQHAILLHATRQAYVDRNILNGSARNNDALTLLASYSGALPDGLGFSASLQFTEAHTTFVTNIIRGVTLGASHPFFDKALTAQCSYALNLTKASSESETDIQHLVTIGAFYRMTAADQFELRTQYNAYHAVNPARRSYSGFTGRVQYSRSFRYGL